METLSCLGRRSSSGFFRKSAQAHSVCSRRQREVQLIFFKSWGCSENRQGGTHREAWGTSIASRKVAFCMHFIFQRELGKETKRRPGPRGGEGLEKLQAKGT